MDFGIRDRDCIDHRDAISVRIFSLMKDRRAQAAVSGERTRPRVLRWAARPTLFDKLGSFRRGAENDTRGARAPQTCRLALVDLSSAKKCECCQRRDDRCDRRREC